MSSGFRSRFLLPFLSAFAVAALAGCPVSQAECSEGTCTLCNADVDCSEEERCVEGRCQLGSTPGPGVAPEEPEPNEPEPDAGLVLPDEDDDGGNRTDAGVADAGVDAGLLDGGEGLDGGGLSDAGFGPLDAGPTDAGPPEPVILAQVRVTAGIDPIGPDDVVRLKIDHARYIAQGLAATDGRDLHLLLDGVSLNRALALSSSWAKADTEIWLKLGTTVAATDSVSISVVSDRTTPPPESLAELAVDLDTFDDGALSDDYVRSLNGQDVSMEEEDGRFVVTMSEDEADAAIVVGRSPLPEDRRFFIQHKIQLNRLTGGGTMNIKTIGVVQWPERPTFAVTNNFGENYRQRVVLNHGGEDFFRSYAYYRNDDDANPSWTGEAFEGNYQPWGELPFHTDHIFEMESDSDQVVLRVRRDDGSLIMQTAPIPWASIKDLEEADGDDQSFGDFWYYWGEVYTFGEPNGGGPYYTADFSSDWIVHLRPAPPQTLVENFDVQ